MNMVLTVDFDVCPEYEEYIDGDLKIGDAGCSGMFDIGWMPWRFEPCIGSYQKVEHFGKYYVLDYIRMMVGYNVEGYFIGVGGKNDRDTPYSRSSDMVYDLWDLCVDELLEDGEDTGFLDKLFAYLLRHCKNNNCCALQIRMDDQDRYRPFYDHCKTHFGMKQWEGYLYKQID